MSKEYPSEAVQLARILCKKLLSTDRYTRKKAMADFENDITSEPRVDQSQYHDMFVVCGTSLINALRDPFEIVRNKAIETISIFFKVLQSNDYYLAHLLPVVAERIGTPEIVEVSEELRLALVMMLLDIIEWYDKHHLKPCVSEFVVILQHIVTDCFAPIKVNSCKCIMLLANAVPQEFFTYSNTLAIPIRHVSMHQHSKVRIIGIQCMGEVILNGDADVFKTCISTLTDKVFDQNNMVRLTLFKVVSRLAQKYRDRYSFFHQLIAIILTGLSDSCDVVRVEVETLWTNVGLQYQKENEKDLKDQLDYLPEIPDTYPKELNRPSLGCRQLVQRCILKLTAGIFREMDGFVSDEIRLRLSQMLRVIVLHAEEGVIQYLPDLLETMYRNAYVSDASVVINVKTAAQYVGFFVPAQNWSAKVLPVLRSRNGSICILAALIYGAKSAELVFCIEDIVSQMQMDMVVSIVNAQVQEDLISVFSAILSHDVLEKLTNTDASQALFNMIIGLQGNLLNDKNKEIMEELVIKLQARLNMSNACEMWQIYQEALLKEINEDFGDWNGQRIKRGTLHHILLNPHVSFDKHLQLIINILANALKPSVDVKYRLETLTVLHKSIDKDDTKFWMSDYSSSFFDRVILDMLIPELVWKPGKAATALRTICASCLAKILSNMIKKDLIKSNSSLEGLSVPLIPILLSLIEDTEKENRLLALENIQLLKQEMCNKEIWHIDDLLKLYPPIIKCLDDPDRNVRLVGAKVLVIIFTSFPPVFSGKSYSAHHEYIIDSLRVYYHDKDEDFRDLIRDAATILSKVRPFNLHDSD